MPQIRLGNVSPVETYKPDEGSDEVKQRPLKVGGKRVGNRVVVMSINEDVEHELSTVRRLWDRESSEPPAWVEGDDDAFASRVAAMFNCEVGQPKGWKEDF